jgi:predicted transcriptional regulator
MTEATAKLRKHVQQRRAFSACLSKLGYSKIQIAKRVGVSPSRVGQDIDKYNREMEWRVGRINQHLVEACKIYSYLVRRGLLLPPNQTTP